MKWERAIVLVKLVLETIFKTEHSATCYFWRKQLRKYRENNLLFYPGFNTFLLHGSWRAKAIFPEFKPYLKIFSSTILNPESDRFQYLYPFLKFKLHKNTENKSAEKYNKNETEYEFWSFMDFQRDWWISIHI